MLSTAVRPLITVLAFAALGTPAKALTLNFGEAGTPPNCSSTADGLGSVVACGDYGYLHQSHGDVAGVADVTYTSLFGQPNSLRWWSTGYNTLYGVAWADGGDQNAHARIEIAATQPGAVVSLQGFDLGAYPSTQRGSNVAVYAIGSATPLFSASQSVGAGNLPTHFAPNVSAVGGLWIEWQSSAYNVGIDHVSFSVSSVPEPASVALLAGGLGLVGLAARRRRSR